MEPAAPGAHLEAFAGWHPAVTEMIGAVPQSPRWGLFTRLPLTRWNRGPVVLLGDAAHAMLPHQGQGANQAIEARRGPWPRNWPVRASAPGAWPLRPPGARVRTRQVQLMSCAASDALHLPDGPAAQRRNASLPRLADRLAWIHAYDAFALA